VPSKALLNTLNWSKNDAGSRCSHEASRRRRRRGLERQGSIGEEGSEEAEHRAEVAESRAKRYYKNDL